jgi:hypothetical protein
MNPRRFRIPTGIPPSLLLEALDVIARARRGSRRPTRSSA